MRLIPTLLLTALAVAHATEPPDVTNQIRHELIMLPYHGIFDHLAFRVDGHTVTLLGQVTRPTLKTDAERAIKRLERVERVDNQIEVLPLSPNDDRIRVEVWRAVYGHAALTRYNLQAVPRIHIVVKNGHVTLQGTVANHSDRNIAGLQANAVGGVFSVANELRLDGGR
jgi:hyperosmotically inducible periplasmic protein